MEVSLESESNKTWMMAGMISLRVPSKKIRTNNYSVEGGRDHQSDEGEEECCNTPTSEESKIPTKFSCPPAPRKRKPSSKCSSNYNGAARQFFTPPDLETVFIRHVN